MFKIHNILREWMRVLQGRMHFTALQATSSKLSNGIQQRMTQLRLGGNVMGVRLISNSTLSGNVELSTLPSAEMLHLTLESETISVSHLRRISRLTFLWFSVSLGRLQFPDSPLDDLAESPTHVKVVHFG